MRHTSSLLAIDPEALICDLTAEMLTDAGYIVHVVQDGEVTLATMTRHRPALIVTDPDGPGDSRGRKRTAERMSAPVVLMRTATQRAALLLGPGSRMCLVKPFDLDALRACVTRYVVAPSRRRPCQRSTYWAWPEHCKREGTHIKEIRL